jgi:tRNA nucleotidyltransferase/poly(A) polymerase
MKQFIPEEVCEVARPIGTYAKKLGLQAWIVGGAVRDFYLNRPTEDIDLTFDKMQDSIAGFCIKQWGGEKQKFAQFGTFQVCLKNGYKLDLARLRTETYERPGVLPQVSFTTGIKQDLFRRDFTVNAWAVSISPDSFGKSVDPYGAKKDIETGRIRILHENSFLDDPTRMYRAVRFAGRFGWKLAPKTERLLREAVDQEYPLLLSSRLRLAKELIKILQEPNAKRIFELMDKYDLLKFIYPNVKWVASLEKTTDPDFRLALLILSLGERSRNFLRSLSLPKPFFTEVERVCALFDERLSPLSPLSDFQRKLVFLFRPDLPSTAVLPCFIRGGELRDIGLIGRRISGALLKVRRAQWEGKVSTRKEAVDLLLRQK